MRMKSLVFLCDVM